MAGMASHTVSLRASASWFFNRRANNILSNSAIDCRAKASPSQRAAAKACSPQCAGTKQAGFRLQKEPPHGFILSQHLMGNSCRQSQRPKRFGWELSAWEIARLLSYKDFIIMPTPAEMSPFPA